MKSTIGVALVVGGGFLIYESLAGKLAPSTPGSFAKPGPLDPGQPPVVGIPPSILPTGYAECIANGGRWNTDTGSCITAG